MEEDIKILKEFVKYYEEEAISRKFRGTLRISVDEDDIQAIENILKVLEPLQKDISYEYEDIKTECLKRGMLIRSLKSYIKNLEKELEPIRELGIPVKTVVAEFERLEDLEDDREQLIEENKRLEQNNLEMQKEAFVNSVPKVEIRKKIEELEEEYADEEIGGYSEYGVKLIKIALLKDLLGDEQ